MHRNSCGPGPDEDSHTHGALVYDYKRETEGFAAA